VAILWSHVDTKPRGDIEWRQLNPHIVNPMHYDPPWGDRVDTVESSESYTLRSSDAVLFVQDSYRGNCMDAPQIHATLRRS
jgi:hypothetical protein